jgi:hypothetical protein
MPVLTADLLETSPLTPFPFGLTNSNHPFIQSYTTKAGVDRINQNQKGKNFHNLISDFK